MFDDPLCSFICVALSLPEARELTRLQKVCMVPALAGENPGLTQINMDIIMEHLNMNITPLQAKVVASVVDLTYRLIGVKDDSLTKFIGRNDPGKHEHYMKALAKRSIYATDRGKGPDSDSDDDDKKGRVYQRL